MADRQKRKRIGKAKIRTKENHCMVDLENIHDDILVEILVRLPVESLMRYKSVSKHWLCLITSPLLVNLFQSRSLVQRHRSSIFLMLPSRVNCWSQDFLIIDPNKSNPLERVTILTPPLDSYPCSLHFAATNIVNGLICLYHRYGWSISMYNLTTRENLPIPTLPPSYSSKSRKCYLGIDPTNQKYKVFHVFSSRDRTIQCHVLTLGSKDKDMNTWRTINTSNIHTKSSTLDPHTDDLGLCHNRVIYCSYDYLGALETTEDNKTRGIFRLSVSSETLDFIPYSEEILESVGEISLCQIGGQVSLVQCTLYEYPTVRDIVLWKLNDQTECKKDNPLWSREVIKFPFPDIRGRRLIRSDNGILCQVRGHFGLLNFERALDWYDIATNTRMVLSYSIKDSVIVKLPDLDQFMPFVIDIENIIPLKDVL